MEAARDPDFQRQRYGTDFYQRMRTLRWLFRYDCRYRLLLMEEVFRRHGVPFEHQRVFELGFGTGDLLRRFDTTSTLHGCELSLGAIEALRRDPRLDDYAEAEFLLARDDGVPRFPGTGYDIVIASHVLEHVPDDQQTLELLAEHTRDSGLGLFFMPLERPRHNPDHARVYTAAGFGRLLAASGWEALETMENFRYASHWVQVINWPSRHQMPVIGPLIEGVKNVALSLPPASFIRLVEQPLERLHVAPYQLMVLARKAHRREVTRAAG